MVETAEERNTQNDTNLKKEEKNNLANYRGITLLSTSLNLFTKIFADKITTLMPISEKQQGFRKKPFYHRCIIYNKGN